DLSYLRCIPNLTVMTPADENECRQMLYTGARLDGPAAVRYPRGTGPGAVVERDMQALPAGRGEVRREGHETALLAFGSPLQAALEAADDLDATVASMRFVKPLDEALILDLAARHELLVTLEDNAAEGGAGSAVAELLAREGVTTPLIIMGIPDRFLEHASRGEQLAECGLDAAGIRARVQRERARRIAKLRAVD
ncbi:MAG TPA: 1-deoxy-D-xylulose-5-phosphate synthase, partial [Gammaproteobacteria bacterium]|nr:1-deoxy-D-xylulose-5-phosphate synthase [Gammaproteobacteria bacterium]